MVLPIHFKFQHTAARRRLVLGGGVTPFLGSVSTHSRPKAAGCATGFLQLPTLFQHTAARRRLAIFRRKTYETQNCFNTQPPEGGWNKRHCLTYWATCFNTQPPEGGWFSHQQTLRRADEFQHTAARRRLGQPLLNI